MFQLHVCTCVFVFQKDKPEFLLFTQVYHLIESRCPRCSLTFLEGDESVQRLEDYSTDNCTEGNPVFRVALKVRYTSARRLFHLLHHHLDIGEDSIFIPLTSRSSQWTIISTCVEDHRHHRLCWRNFNYVQSPSSVSGPRPTTFTLIRHTAGIKLTSPTPPPPASSSAIHTTNNAIVFATFAAILFTSCQFKWCNILVCYLATHPKSYSRWLISYAMQF